MPATPPARDDSCAIFLFSIITIAVRTVQQVIPSGRVCGHARDLTKSQPPICGPPESRMTSRPGERREEERFMLSLDVGHRVEL